MAANYFHGLTLSWAINGVTCSTFGASSLIQSIDGEQLLSEVTVMDQSGNTAIWVGHDTRKTAVFEYVPATSSTPASGSAVVSALLPTAGTMITVADAIDTSNPLKDTNWIVQSVVQRRMNTDATKVTVRAISFLGVTA